MPTVPTYNEPQVQEAPVSNAHFGVDTNLSDFGGGEPAKQVMDAADNLATSAGDMVDAHQRMADQMYSGQLRTKLENIKNNLLYNPQSGLIAMKGVNALAAPEVMKTSFDDQTADLQKTTQNDRQRKVFDALKERTFRMIDAQVQRHVFSESQIADKADTDAAVKSAQNDATLNYQNPDAVNMAAQNLDSTLDLYGKRQGWSQAVLAQQKTDALSKLHTGVLEQMVNNGEDLLGQNYYDYHKDQMNEADQVAANKMLQLGSIKGESQRIAGQILSQTNDEATAMKLLDESGETDQRKIDAARDRLKDTFSLRETMKRQRQEAASDAANDIIMRGGSPDDVPISLRVQMTPVAQKANDNLWRYKKEGVEPPQNWTKYADIIEMASNPNTRQKFINTDPMTFRNDLDNAHFNKVVDMRAGMIKGDAAADAKIGEVRTNQKVIQDSLENAKITYPPKTKDDKQKLSQFSQQYFDSLNQFEQTKGGKATDQEKQQVADKLLVPVATTNGWFGTSWGNGAKPIFQVGVSDIPVEEKQKIDAYLLSRGIQPTDRMRAQQYQMKLQAMQNGK